MAIRPRLDQRQAPRCLWACSALSTCNQVIVLQRALLLRELKAFFRRPLRFPALALSAFCILP